ncbi:hypothetical protein B0H13DRAFT_1940983 [Mycena leptocephala]|nr:hypothetical protein B0H13DRAFT_1940983 [Mycena leptocephala]
MNDDDLGIQSKCAEFRAAVLGLCADIYTRIADLVEKAPASALQQCFDGSEHNPLAVINATTELCDILCNLEPDPQLIKANPGLLGPPCDLEPGHPGHPPDSDLNIPLGEPELRDPARSESNMDPGESDGEENEHEATEAHIRVSGVVDWSVDIDVHRFMSRLLTFGGFLTYTDRPSSHAKPAIDPAVLFMDDSDITMTEEANFPPSMPALPPKWTNNEKDIAMKLFTQELGGEDRRRWFRRIAMSLPNKTSGQVSEFYHYCSENHLL